MVGQSGLMKKTEHNQFPTIEGMTRAFDLRRLFALFVFCGLFFLIPIVGCQLVAKTPSRDLYNYKFMSTEWKAVVEEIVGDPERQANILESSRKTGDGFEALTIESQEIRRDYLKILACHDCDSSDFEPLLKRIQTAEEGSTHMILDFLDVVRDNTTPEELKLLIKRKLEP